MALRFIDGQDYFDFPGADFKYESYSTFVQGSVDTGRGGTPATGKGRSLTIFNTAFGCYCRTKILTASNIWTWGFSYKVTGGNDVSTSIFQRWESALTVNSGGLDPNPGVELAIRQTRIDATSARWDLFTGGTGVNANPGTLLASPSQIFAKDVWYYVEFIVQFGAHGGIAMYVNDALVYTDTNINVGTTNPDRFTRRWQSFGQLGYSIDDLYIDDSTRQGPLRISAHFPTADASPHQWTPSSGSSHYLMVHEGTPGYGTVLSAAPDFDTTYVQAASAGQDDFYTFGTDPCYGKILGIAVNACARKVSGAGPTLDLLVRTPDLVTTTLGNFALPPGPVSPFAPPYFTGQAISEASIYTGGTWTDRELLNASWGFRSQGVGVPRVTQFFLEKAVGLQGLPYDCGAQSYAY